MHKLLCLVPAVFLAAPSPAVAHYNMLLPSAASGKKGEAVTFTYQWGHPFEHQLFDAPKPEKIDVRAPDGKIQDLTSSLEKVALPVGEGKSVTGYRFPFTPEQRGDYVFLLKLPPIFMEEDGEFIHDIVKVVYHVQAQKGWDAALGDGLELLPLTRPYGLEPGMVFQVQTIPSAHVEIESYHAAPPKSLPPDEQITRVVRADRSGVATGTLTEPGWWCLTTTALERGKRKHGDKELPVRQRSTRWVFVDEKAGEGSWRS
jgi:cobalt/nickel transport protein